MEDQSTHSGSTPSTLQAYLNDTPKLYEYTFNDATRRAVLDTCYQFLWNHDTSYKRAYFAPNDKAFDKLMETGGSSLLPMARSKKDMLHTTNSLLENSEIEAEYQPSQRGKQCGHVFQKGETVYRCRTCGLDDTCVFCSRCFHSTNHEGHDVSFSVSPGSGGCCDCGDPESWKYEINCAYHSPMPKLSSAQSAEKPSKTDSIPGDLRSALHTTIGAALDFILETFACSPEDKVTATNINGDSQSIRSNAFFRDSQTIKMSLSNAIRPSVFTTTHTDGDEDVSMMDVDDADTGENESKAPSEVYACILWNDESHSYPQVIDQLMSAAGCTEAQAKTTAENVNLYGRDIIKLSSNVEELLNIATSLSTIGLAVTIRTAHDTFREQVCTLLLDWLKDLVSGRLKCFENIEQGDSILREVVCDELCVEYTLPPDLAVLSLQTGQTRGSDDESEDDPSVDMDFEETAGHQTTIGATDATEEGFGGLDVQPRDVWSMPANVHRRRLATAISTGQESDSDAQHDTHSSNSESAQLSRRHRHARAHKQNVLKRYDIADLNWDYNALLNQYNELALEEAGIHDEMSAKIFKSTAVGKKVADGMLTGTKLRQEYERKLRLDYLMLFDLRLWKEVRLALRQLFISSLAPRPNFKKQIAIRLARNYVTLADAFLLRDREPENSIILFSVQLLTVPTIASLVVNECHFLGQICSVLSSFFLTDCVSLPLVLDRQQVSMRVNCEARSFRSRRYFSAFHDLRYIINTELVKESIIREPLYLRQYIGLIIMFQDMNAVVRQADTHIEYESETWVNAFNVTLQIAKCCRQFSECYAITSNDMTKIEESKALVRAILRILRMFSDWVASDEENEISEATEPGKEKQPQPRIAGIQEQEYHMVELAGTGSYWVIKYNVANQPVSFHHPLHWLMAGLLENVRLLEDETLKEAGWQGSFCDLIRGTDQCRFDFIDDRRLLAILEYPIRTIVLLAQIRAGVWVRNGYGVRNQAHHYREISLRENTFDADVFLVQLGFSVVDPDTLLATLLDRFQLDAWFADKAEQPECYDASQLIFMVEELLNLLIVCVAERANATGMTLEQKVQREIIHSLCLSPLPHSDLVKSIPDRLHENFAFDTILSSVAHLKQPEGLHDLGQYELLNKHFDEVDPYFWHYTRNNREEAEQVLRKKAQQNQNIAPEDYFYLPKLPKIMSGPFTKLGNLLHSKVFVHIIFYALYNTKQGKTTGKSDTVLDQTLHLVLLALVDENNDYISSMTDGGQSGFVQFASTVEFHTTESGNLTLLQLLLQLLDMADLKDIHPRCEWIINQIEARGSQLAQDMIQQRRQDKDSPKTDEPTAAMNERERQKQLSKDRQAKILAQFAQAQSQFLEQHEDLYDDEDDEFGSVDMDSQAMESEPQHADHNEKHWQTRQWQFPTGTCIVCQEDAHDRSQQYGILCLIQTSNILREFPPDNDDILNDILEYTAGSPPEEPEANNLAETKMIRGFPRQSHKSGMYASTCGHLMHISCFDTYCASIDVRHQSQPTRNQPENTSRREFVCPLCKSLGNALLPIAWKSKRESYPGILSVADNAIYAQYLQQEVHRHVEELGALVKTNGHGRQRRRAGTPSRYREGFTSLSSSLRVESHEMPASDHGIIPYLPPSTPPPTISQDRGPLSGLNFGSGGNAPNPLGPFGNETLNNNNLELGPISKSYAQLSEVMRLSCQALSLVCGDKTMEALRLSNFVKNVDLLWSLYGFTISTIEIALRSQKTVTVEAGGETTNTLIDYIAPQMQTLLRILPETIVAFTSVRNSGLSNDPKLNLMAMGRLVQLYPSIAVPRNVMETSLAHEFSYQNQPLLLDDPFLVLAELSLYYVTVLDIPVYHLMRTLYLAEVVKATIGIMQAMDGRPNHSKTQALLAKLNSGPSSVAPGAITEFVVGVMEPLSMSRDRVTSILADNGGMGESAFIKTLQTFVLPFVRKCMILMVTRHGLLVPSQPTQADWPVEQEIQHLCGQLRLPQLATLLDRTDILAEEQSLVLEWSRVLALEPTDQQQYIIPLNLPIPCQLVKLPRRLDELFEISLRCVCHRCGTVPNDPALCLLCGTFVCSQSYCCSEGEYGECNLHQSVCGGEIGIYLDVKRCVILLLRTGNGCFISAPYLDWHGEVDLGLKRGRPQFLNQKRYDDIVKLWLQHSIPVYVGRKLEATYDCGGWETM
ncbi:hypothetical protein INT43_005025 [Umbelopsis isabellina]|uniref:E3 ubiquitin-protein ligase n=1 Tax=Mortierella isabellina TaxID=91625 RepID=A0A8H7PGM3_MORIS|nr:hypothetical protein INT43_005025 [Umbelopsis isabellina]